MGIIFGSDVGIREDAFGSFVNQISNDIALIGDSVNNILNNTATLPPPPPRENVYVDDGFSNVPGTAFEGSQIENIDDFKRRRITSQEPNATVYIQKRAFSTLKDENDTKYLDSGEKFLLRATKILFEKKCSQFAAYEALTKIKNILSDEAELDAERVDILVSLLEGVSSDVTDAINQDLENLFLRQGDIPNAGAVLETAAQEIEKLETITENLKALAGKTRKTGVAQNTTWVVDPDDVPDIVGIGRGVGTIELTLVSNINTSLSLDISSGGLGSFSFTIQDPYNMSKITSDEIESAITAAIKQDSINDFTNVSRGPQLILDDARKEEAELNKRRRNRVNTTFANFGTSTPPVGSVLSGGDASEIIFTINPASEYGNQVTISSTTSTEVFDSVGAFALSLLQLPLEQQLNSDELDRTTKVFNLLTSYLNEIKRLNDSALTDNNDPDVRYARKKLRFYYLGKNIVQPMDSVHIFMRSNTFKDGQVAGPLSSLLNGSPYLSSVGQDTLASEAVLEEEMRQFGLDELNIPTSVYRSLRTSSFLRNAGTHVFGGLVDSASESFSAGQGYQLRVNGKSNLKWLKLSRTNTKPQLDQSLRGGLLEDPLTPYDLSQAVDEATGLLLDEPPLLPENINNPAVRFNSGIFKGKRATAKNIVNDVTTIGNNLVPILGHPNGLVYKWKEGIITATINNNLRTALGASPFDTKKLQRDMGLNLTTNPFASMDAADIISVLITGFPHNYESFVLNASSTGALAVGGTTNEPDSFFHSFFDITRSTNRALGNFQPIKTINISKEQMAERIKIQADLKNNSKKIRDLRVEKARILDQINSLNIVAQREEGGDVDNIRSAAAEQLNNLNAEVSRKLDDEVKSFYGSFGNEAAERSGLRIYGNDLAFEIERSGSGDDDDRQEFRSFRLKNILRNIRTQFDVKFNQDSNLFIVSDDYDKDLDIQAFALQMADKAPDLFNSDYKFPYDICKTVAEKIDFELFCDSQGHIQFRPPKYNKVPLSLILKLILLDQNENKKLYPSFIESLFKNKLEGTKNDVDIARLEIRIRQILLNAQDTSEASDLVIDENITEDPITNKFLGDNAISAIADRGLNIRDLAEELVETRIALAAKLGNKPPVKDDPTLKAAGEEIKPLNDPSAPNFNSLRLVKTNELSKLQSKLQQLKRTEERFSKQKDSFRNKKPKDNLGGSGIKSNVRLTPDKINTLIFPFMDLVEDDFFDYLGPGSSERYIITDEQILDYNFTESDDNVVMRVEVTGEQDLLKGSGSGDIAGVPTIVAGATDFDLWRMYGYRTGNPQSKPYFKDAETQCAPYALMLLNRARRDILRGQITVVGNEYYQLGDVVYINSRDMLYYVTKVSHNFAYDGGRFTTSLELRYGHPLGDYIPTPLDVIGKNLIKNQTRFNRTITNRKTTGGQQGVHLGVVVFPPNSESAAPENVKQDMLSGGIGHFNIVQLKTALTRARAQMHKSQDRSVSKYPIVEVRGFVVNDDQKGVVASRIREVKKWLLNPTGRFFTDSDEQIKLGRKFTEDLKLQDKDKSGFGEIADFEDPININDPGAENIRLARYPRNEVFNVSKTRDDPSNVIEIVLVLQEPTNKRDSILFG